METIMADQVGKGHLSTTGHIQVNENGSVALYVALREAILIQD
jgi:hypothetical protein